MHISPMNTVLQLLADQSSCPRLSMVQLKGFYTFSHLLFILLRTTVHEFFPPDRQLLLLSFSLFFLPFDLGQNVFPSEIICIFIFYGLQNTLFMTFSHGSIFFPPLQIVDGNFFIVVIGLRFPYLLGIRDDIFEFIELYFIRFLDFVFFGFSSDFGEKILELIFVRISDNFG